MHLTRRLLPVLALIGLPLYGSCAWAGQETPAKIKATDTAIKIVPGNAAPVTTQTPAAPDATAPASEAATAETPPRAGNEISERIYAQVRDTLFQVRTLLAKQDTQRSIGTGFLVSADGHIITNYHVISDYALNPKQYRLVYQNDTGHSGSLDLLAFDVVHDLALLRVHNPSEIRQLGVLTLRPERELTRGESIFALGNPLDVGFAVAEGKYNGNTSYSYLPQIFFGGALSPGMSGGPAVDRKGEVIGINVATHVGGQQVSFLVPVKFASELFAKSSQAVPITGAIDGSLTTQLLDYQARLVNDFIKLGWLKQDFFDWQIPVAKEKFIRCWGGSTKPSAPGLRMQNNNCSMNGLYTGINNNAAEINIRHEFYDGRHLTAWRFYSEYSASFRNEFMQKINGQQSAAQCSPKTMAIGNKKFKTVICLSAYDKLAALYDLSIIVVGLSDRNVGFLSRLDAETISYASASALTQYYLSGFAAAGADHAEQ